MSKIDLSTYPRDTLEQLLGIVKDYRTALKQIGKRAILIDPKNPPKESARIEYPSTMDAISVSQYAAACIKYAFPEYIGPAPTLLSNDTLTWGARVFVGDDMVDVSFQRFETLIKK